MPRKSQQLPVRDGRRGQQRRIRRPLLRIRHGRRRPQRRIRRPLLRIRHRPKLAHGRRHRAKLPHEKRHRPKRPRRKRHRPNAATPENASAEAAAREEASAEAAAREEASAEAAALEEASADAATQEKASAEAAALEKTSAEAATQEEALAEAAAREEASAEAATQEKASAEAAAREDASAAAREEASAEATAEEKASAEHKAPAKGAEQEKAQATAIAEKNAAAGGKDESKERDEEKEKASAKADAEEKATAKAVTEEKAGAEKKAEAEVMASFKAAVGEKIAAKDAALEKAAAEGKAEAKATRKRKKKKDKGTATKKNKKTASGEKASKKRGSAAKERAIAAEERAKTTAKVSAEKYKVAKDKETGEERASSALTTPANEAKPSTESTAASTESAAAAEGIVTAAEERAAAAEKRAAAAEKRLAAAEKRAAIMKETTDLAREVGSDHESAFLSAAEDAWTAREDAAAAEFDAELALSAGAEDAAEDESVDSSTLSQRSKQSAPAKRLARDNDSDEGDKGLPLIYQWIEAKLTILVKCGNNEVPFKATTMSDPKQKLPFLHGPYCKRNCYCKDWWVHVRWDTRKTEWVSCGRCLPMPEKGETRSYEPKKCGEKPDELAVFMRDSFPSLKNMFPQEFGSAINSVLVIVDILGGKLCTLKKIGIERIIREITTLSVSMQDDNSSWDSPRFKFGKGGNDCHFDIKGVSYDGKLDIRALEVCLNRWLPNRDFIISRSTAESFHGELLKHTRDCVSVAHVILNRTVLGEGQLPNHTIRPCVPSKDALEDKYDRLFQTSVVVSHSSDWPGRKLILKQDSEGKTVVTGSCDIGKGRPLLYESTLRQAGLNCKLIPTPIDGYIETTVPYKEVSENALVKRFLHAWTISERMDGSKKIVHIAQEKGKEHTTSFTINTWVPGEY